MRRVLSCLLALAAGGGAIDAAAQVRLDRADPSIAERALPAPAAPPATPARTIAPAAAPRVAPALRHVPRIARSIVVDGTTDLTPLPIAPIAARYVGRDLGEDDLAALASAVAGAARDAGYPFATASVERQGMADGVLHVTLDAGRVDAVRVLGSGHAFADRMLSHALVTGRPIRKGQLDRALALASDLPGVVVTESKYVRQDGFGILLVTIEEDRASAYLQIDNRGSKEVGPERSTLLANLRSVASSGDELSLLAANTPFQPREFAFVRGRYASPIDLSGSTLSVSASYGRARPGAFLKPFDVIGHSVDTAVGYARPLLRRRDGSLWANLEFRALSSDQSLLGQRLRDDRLATLTGSLSGARTMSVGAIRGEVAMAVGLPLAGVTRQGDPRTSRADGDARFVLWSYSAEWVGKIGKRVGFALASAGQLASRPLLASAEIGAGGPTFGRGFDYAERTGDSGILGSAELRADAAKLLPRVLDRVQFYGFVDGGHVANLRRGFGGGSLLSSGTGLRLGRGRLDGAAELAFPLNADRLSSGDRGPRVSFRLSRSF